MTPFRLLLLPFSLLYGVIIWIRNKFYDWKIFKSTSFNLPVISVGNLEVGGSGKTPLVEYLINLLQENLSLATLSRGYGRKTTGFRWVKENDDSFLCGDEPLQIKNKFPAIGVAVSEDRVKGIEQLRKDYDVILMDDAFQHRAVKPGLSILLFDYNRLNKPKYLLPAGNYRESFKGKDRADIIVITKSPGNLPEEEKGKIVKSFNLEAHQKLFFSTIAYSATIQHVFNKHVLDVEQLRDFSHIILLTGIARPESLLAELKKYNEQINHHNYPDHHQFSRKNMLKLVADFKGKSVDTIIITTEKDAVRLKSHADRNLIELLPIYAWPIEVKFLEGAMNFREVILNYVKAY